MAEIVGLAEAFAGTLAEVAPVLDERARRLLMGAAARQLGAGWDHADRRCDGRRLGTNTYQKGVRITDKAIDRLRDRPPATTQVPRQLELHRDGHASRQHDTPGRAGEIYQ